MEYPQGYLKISSLNYFQNGHRSVGSRSVLGSTNILYSRRFAVEFWGEEFASKSSLISHSGFDIEHGLTRVEVLWFSHCRPNVQQFYIEDRLQPCCQRDVRAFCVMILSSYIIIVEPRHILTPHIYT